MVEPFDLALPGLGDVDAVLVEEADHDRLRVLLEEPDGDPAEASARAHLEAGDRDRGDLEVLHVDACGVAADDDGPLEHPGRAAVSREVVMVLPFSSVLAHAIDSRMTSSGLMSTLARPVMPRRPNRLRGPRDSHTIEVLTVAPASTVLKG